jgi:hypothetical protein
MQHISISERTLSELRFAAKNLAKSSNIKHGQALDEVAQEAGFNHWKHALICADETTTRSKIFNLFDKKQRPFYMVVDGVIGTGKSLFVSSEIVKHINEGKYIVLIDLVSSIKFDFINKLNGSISILDSKDPKSVVRDGIVKAFFYDYDFNYESVELIRLINSAENTVFVIDESSRILKQMGKSTVIALEEALSRGNSIILSCQMHDSSQLPICPGPHTKLKVTLTPNNIF